MKQNHEYAEHEHNHDLSVSSNGSTWVKPQFAREEWAGVPHLSVSSNGSTWVKPLHGKRRLCLCDLSVSSNGSTWVKLRGAEKVKGKDMDTFSILERIDVGET